MPQWYKPINWNILVSTETDLWLESENRYYFGRCPCTPHPKRLKVVAMVSITPVNWVIMSYGPVKLSKIRLKFIYNNNKLWEIFIAALKSGDKLLPHGWKRTLYISSNFENRNHCFLWKQRTCIERWVFYTTCKRLKALVERIWNLLTVALSWIVKVVSLSSFLAFLCRV